MKTKALLLLLVVLVSATLVGCSNTKDNSQTIAVSFYPIEYVTKRIVGDDYKVVNITPVGVEPHDIEMSPNNTELLLNAKLTIVLGNGFQPAVEKTVNSRTSPKLSVIDSVLGKQKAGSDPHVWLDPVLMKKVVVSITDSLVELSPKKREVYVSRSKKLVNDLELLNDDFENTLSNCKQNTFISSHDSFSRLAKRYGLNQESIAGISPENEPSPARLAELRDLVKDKNISTIFTEELVSKKVADTLSREAGVKTKILSPIEGLTSEQKANNDDYFDLMKANLSSLSDALGCSES